MKRVGIIRGGPGMQYASSVNRGGEILLHILENLNHKYRPVDILIDKDHLWHANGIPVQPEDLANQVDIVWNTSHPDFSVMLAAMAIPSIGVGHFPFALLENREELEEHVRRIGLKMPRYVLFPAYQRDFDGPLERYAQRKATEVFEKFGAPWVVKFFTEQSGVDAQEVRTFAELVDVVRFGAEIGAGILVEEGIQGQNVFVHSVRRFRGKDVYAFSSSNIHRAEKEKIISLAQELHDHLGAKHYLRSNFVIHPRRGISLSNVYLTPDFKEDSDLHQACEHIGIETHEFIDHILTLN